MKNPFETSVTENPFVTKDKIVQNPFLTHNNSNKDIKFINVVNTLKDSNETILNIYGNSLEQIGDSLNDTNSTEVRNILVNISSTKNYDKIGEYIGELQKIVDEYQKGKKGVSEKMKLKQIKEKIKGSVDNFISGLRKQLETKGNGKVSLKLGDNIIIPFSTKQEALKYIDKLEEDLNDESTLWKIAINGLDLISQPFQWPYKFGKEYVVPNFSKDTSEWEWLGDGTILALLSAMALNYGETLYRRYAIDVFAKMGVKNHPFISEKYIVKNDKGEEVEKWRKKRLTIPDYSLRKSYFAGDADLRDEYLQRISVLDQLQNELELKTGKEKELFRQKLENVKSLLNVNTKSFYLEAYALKKGLWNPRRFYWAFRNGIIPFGQDLAQKAQTEFNLKESGVLDKYNAGLDYTFDGGRVEIDENDHIRIKGIDEQIKQKQYSENIKKFFYAIESDDSLSSTEKKNRKERIEDFLKTLDNAPRTEEYIKNKLYNIAKNGILEKSDILAKINKALEKYTPEENKLGNGKGFSEWLSDLPKEAKQNFMKYFSKIYGKNAPAILTKGQAGLIKLKYFTEALGIELNEVELDKLISEIESGKIEFSRLYEGTTGKLRFLKDISAKSFLAILRGDNIEFTKMKKYSDKVSEGDLKDYLDKGEDYLKSVEKAKELFKSGKLGNSLKHIFEYDNSIFDEQETILKEILEDLEKEVQEGKLTEEEAILEIKKLYSGYFTRKSLLSKLDIIELGLDKSIMESDSYKAFRELVETGKYTIKLDDLEILENELKSGNIPTTENISSLNLNSIDIKDIEKEGKELYEQRAEQYYKENGVEKLTSSKVNKTELTLLDKITELEGYSIDETKKDKLLNAIDNGNKFTAEKLLHRIMDIYGLDYPSTSNIKIVRKALGKKIVDKLEELKIDYEKIINPDRKRVIIEEMKGILNVSDNPPYESSIIKALKNVGFENIGTYIDKIVDFKKVEGELKTKADLEKEKQEKIEQLKTSLEDIKNRITTNQGKKEYSLLLKKEGNLELILNTPELKAIKEEIDEELDKQQKTKSQPKSSKEKLSPEKQKLIEFATKNPEEFSQILKDFTERFELRLILEEKETSNISNNPLDIILEVQENPKKYSEGLLIDFVQKANINGINFKGVKHALEDMNVRLELNKKINELGKSELMNFWEKAKELGKDFFKEVKKGTVKFK